MDVLTTSIDISNFIGVNEKKARELLFEGVIPSISTGNGTRVRYYTLPLLIEYAYKKIKSLYPNEAQTMRDAFLIKGLNKSIHSHMNQGGKARVITVSNLKGGVGKTTDAVNLGVVLAKLGQRVLIVDMDAQAQSSRYFRKISYHGKSILALFEKYAEAGEVTADEVKSKIVTFDDLGEGDYTIDILPSEIRLAKKLELLRMNLRPETILSNILAPVLGDYDIVLVDTPPYPGLSLEQSLYAADSVLVATEAEEFSIEGLESTLAEIGDINKFTNRTLKVDSIFVNAFTRHAYQQEALEAILDIYDDKLGGVEGGSEMYLVKSSNAIVGAAQAKQLPIIGWLKKPREALLLAEPFFEYGISLINRNKGESK